MLRKFPYEMSGGQRQRVGFAQALAVRPKLILADEPVSMLDVSIRAGILNMMARLRAEEGASILYITHDIASARYVADRIIVMYAGHAVEQGPTEVVLRDRSTRTRNSSCPRYPILAKRLCRSPRTAVSHRGSSTPVRDAASASGVHTPSMNARVSLLFPDRWGRRTRPRAMWRSPIPSMKMRRDLQQCPFLHGTRTPAAEVLDTIPS